MWYEDRWVDFRYEREADSRANDQGQGRDGMVRCGSCSVAKWVRSIANEV